jgi:hypothetical protein
MSTPTHGPAALLLLGFAAIAPTLAAACAGAAPSPPLAEPLPAPTSPPPLAEPLPAPTSPPPTASTAPAPTALPDQPAPRCPARCTGMASAELQSALLATAHRGTACYNRALRTRDVTGQFVVSVKVSETGGLCESRVIDDRVGASDLTDCVLGLFRSTRMPPATGGCATVNVPFSFLIKDGGPPADAASGG